jgi:hypothetical protein
MPIMIIHFQRHTFLYVEYLLTILPYDRDCSEGPQNTARIAIMYFKQYVFAKADIDEFSI